MQIANHLKHLTLIRTESVVNDLKKPEPGLKKPETPEEKDFFLARESPLVRNASLDELKAVLIYVIMKLGLRAINWPKEEERALLIDHMLKFFGGHTLAEIRLAFDMAIDRKLKVEANCFENFCPLYFSNVMNTYREWAVCVHDHEQLTKTMPMIENKVSLSDQTMNDWLEDTKAAVKEGKAVDYMPEMLYDFLVSKDVFEELDPFDQFNSKTQDYLVRAMNYRQAILKDRANEGNRDERSELSEFMRMKNQGYFQGIEINRLVTLAKKMILFDYLKK